MITIEMLVKVDEDGGVEVTLCGSGDSCGGVDGEQSVRVVKLAIDIEEPKSHTAEIEIPLDPWDVPKVKVD